MAARYESDPDDLISEIDISLSVNGQPYHYEPVVLRYTSILPEKDNSNECSSQSDMQWFVDLYENVNGNETITQNAVVHAFLRLVYYSSIR